MGFHYSICAQKAPKGRTQKEKEKIESLLRPGEGFYARLLFKFMQKCLKEPSPPIMALTAMATRFSA
jgi:hypothetical protein